MGIKEQPTVFENMVEQMSDLDGLTVGQVAETLHATPRTIGVYCDLLQSGGGVRRRDGKIEVLPGWLEQKQFELLPEEYFQPQSRPIRVNMKSTPPIFDSERYVRRQIRQYHVLTATCIA